MERGGLVVNRQTGTQTESSFISYPSYHIMPASSKYPCHRLIQITPLRQRQHSRRLRLANLSISLHNLEKNSNHQHNPLSNFQRKPPTSTFNTTPAKYRCRILKEDRTYITLRINPHLRHHIIEFHIPLPYIPTVPHRLNSLLQPVARDRAV